MHNYVLFQRLYDRLEFKIALQSLFRAGEKWACKVNFSSIENLLWPAFHGKWKEYGIGLFYDFLSNCTTAQGEQPETQLPVPVSDLLKALTIFRDHCLKEKRLEAHRIRAEAEARLQHILNTQGL